MPLSSPQLSTSTLSPADKYSVAILSTPGVAAYWRLGDASGSAAEKVKGRNGTYTGTITQGATALASTQDAATTFGGGYIACGSGPLLQGLSNFTIEMWVKCSTGQMTLYSERQSAAGNDVIIVRLNDTSASTGLCFVYRDDANTINRLGVGAVNAFSDNLPHHFVVTKAGTAVILYVDGVNRGNQSLTATDTLTNTGMTVTLGADVAPAQALTFSGVMDEVAVYSRTLSATEVRHHYELGIGL